MKKFLVILFLLITVNANANLYYIYLDRESPILNSVEYNERGDVIAIVDAKKITPSKKDYVNFKILKVNMTELQKEKLLSLKEDAASHKILKSSKYKIKYKLINLSKEHTYNEIQNNIIINK